MSTSLTQDQVDKFRALGTAARKMAREYEKGEGPNPQSGSTFHNGVPMCTWGQLLHKAGMKANGSTGDNLGALDAFIRGGGAMTTTLLTGPAVQAIKDGLFYDKKVTYDIKKIKDLGTKVMRANDPQTTPEARKAATWKILDELADEIEKVFGEQPEEQQMYYSTAAEQALENLIMGTEE